MAEAAGATVAARIITAYSYVGLWIGLSGAVIMFNKYLLAYAGFPYPITLTMWCAGLGGGRGVSVLSAGVQAAFPAGWPGVPQPHLEPTQHPWHRHMFFCATLAVGLVKSGKVAAINMDRDTYMKCASAGGRGPGRCMGARPGQGMQMQA